jgi:serine/threonine-protein kinase
LVLAALCLFAAPALAVTPEEKAAAEAQFDEGVKLLKAGNYDAAAKKFESSQRIDPGIGTLLYLGECYEKSGKTASAWATFREAASMAQAAGQGDRARIGTQRAARLEDKLSKLTIEVPEADMSIEGIEIQTDKRAVAKSLWGTPAPVDPGDHVVSVSAPGYRTAEVKVTVTGAGQNQTLSAPVLEKLPPGETPVVAPAPVAATGGAAATPTDSGTSDGSAQRVTGLVIGGVGVAGLGVGAVFGILAISDNNTAKDNGCSPGDGNCPAGATGVADANKARDEATVSTIAFIAGGVLVATGATLYLTAPDAPQTAHLEVVPTYGGAALSFGGNF